MAENPAKNPATCDKFPLAYSVYSTKHIQAPHLAQLHYV